MSARPTSAPPAQDQGEAERIERHPRGGIGGAILVSLSIVALVLVIMSYFTDVFPDRMRDAVDFVGWRFAFLVLSVAIIAFVIEREFVYRRSLRRLSAEQHRLVELDRTRADIVANVTHELKTPLTSLLGYAQLLRRKSEDLEPQERTEYVDVIERQAQRVLHLIEGLLQSSRLEGGLGRLERRPLDLSALVRAIAEETSVARGRRITVAAPQEDLGVFGDPTAIEHVITNILDNALKYSTGDIDITLHEGEGEVLLSVRDTGSGISDDELPYIFERFRQAQNATGNGSVGLGLYIVRNLVEAHGGRVLVESEEGKGSTFTVALPRRRGR